LNEQKVGNMEIKLGINCLLVTLCCALFAACNNKDGESPIFGRGERLSREIITGKAWHNKLLEEDSVYRTAIGVEEFEAGSRNVWHSHPSGQIIIVLEGEGYHQIKGGPIQLVKKGDIVKCPPNTLHWHGASKNRSVTQMYILPNTEKGLVEWDRQVSDKEYNSLKDEQQ